MISDLTGTNNLGTSGGSWDLLDFYNTISNSGNSAGIPDL